MPRAPLTIARLRPYAALVLIASAVGIGLLIAPAESYRLTRLSLLACVGGGLLALGVLLARPRWLLWSYLGALALGLGTTLLPGGAPTAATYARRLTAFRDAPYHWGGETHGGIDCSGLLRAGYVEACIADAWNLRDPRLLRHAVDVWYHDSSASDLLAGFAGRVTVVGDGIPINHLDPATLHPGDMAVTAHGIHCLVYVGDGAWASADPGLGKVVILRAPDPSFQWYTCAVGIRRWQALH